MFYFLLRKSARITLDPLLAGRGKPFAHLIEPLFYEDLHLKNELRPGTFAFTDMDRLRPQGRLISAYLHDYLSSFPGQLKVLNHPVRTLSRYDLLKELNAAGINDFRICKASEDLSGLSMPVFLRSALGHNPILTDLLYTQKDLQLALTENRMLGHRPENVIVIEFCDTRDENGIFTKYSALKIGDHIFPRHVNFSTNWFVKSGRSHVDHSLHLKHHDHISWYYSTNPHKEWLERINKIARVDYGRIDYSVLNGKPQLWEINTNPTYGLGHGTKLRDPYSLAEEPYRQLFYAAFFDVLQAMGDEKSNRATVPLAPLQSTVSEIQKHLELPEDKLKGHALLRKVAKSKKKWVRQVWKAFVRTIN
jgi:hypothetical protein